MSPSEILKRPYARVVLPDSDGTFSAEIVEFSGCIAVGSTASEALDSLESVAIDWIGAALAQRQDIPEPMDSAGYSGKLVVRMAKGLHRRAALYAERDGVSLNQFIITCIAQQVGERARPTFTQVHSAQLMANLQVNFVTGAAMALPTVIGSAPAQPALTAYTGQSVTMSFPAERIHARN